MNSITEPVDSKFEHITDTVLKNLESEDDEEADNEAEGSSSWGRISRGATLKRALMYH